MKTSQDEKFVKCFAKYVLNEMVFKKRFVENFVINQNMSLHALNDTTLINAFRSGDCHSS